MKRIFDRRTLTAWLGLACLTWVSTKNGTDVSMAVAGIVLAIAGSNAYEKKGSKDGTAG